MREELRYILSSISVKSHPEWGAYIELIDYEHRDYIEDVLCENFNLDYAFCLNEDITGGYVLYFAENASIEAVEKSVSEINEFHKINEINYNVSP